MKQLRNLTLVCLFAIGAIGVMTSFKAFELNQHPVVEQIKAQLKLFAQQEAPEKVYLHFDKTLYKPGEWIWFNAYCRNANNLTIENTSGIVHVAFYDPKGTVIKTEQLQLVDGSVGGSFQVGPDKSGGMYKIKAWTNWMKNGATIFERDIMIQKSVLPILNMKLEFEEKGYSAGDEVLAHLKLENLENEALRNYRFDIKVKLEGEEYQSLSGVTTHQGKADIRFKLPKSLASNDGLLNILIPYRGQTESISRSIPIVLNDIDLQFFPEGGDLVHNLKTKVAFKALNEFGKPTDVEGIIIDEFGAKVANFSSYHDGMGVFDLKPESHKKYAAKITKPKGLDKTYPLPKSKYNGYGLNIVTQTRHGITAEVKGASQQSEIHLIAQNGADILYSNSFVLDKKQTIYIPTEEFPLGISRLTLIDELNQPQCERLVFCNMKKQLNIEVKTNKEKYLPREQVNLSIKVTDENGDPVQGKFSLSVADESLLTFSDDKQGHILSSILLESELKGEISEPNFYFETAEEALSRKDKSKAMDMLMMTHGWRRFNWQEVLSNEQPIANYKKEKTTIEGIILDKDNQPIEGATVSILNPLIKTISDKEGKFVIDKHRFYRRGIVIKVAKEGYPTYRHICNDYKSDLAIVLDDRKAALKGVVKSEKGQLIANSTFSLINQFDYAIKKQVAYQYEFKDVYPGLYTLEIENKNFPKKVIRNIWLNGDMEIEMDHILSNKTNSNKKATEIVTTFNKEIQQGNFKFKGKEQKVTYTQPGNLMDQNTMAGLDVMDSIGSGLELDEVVVTAYKIPLIEKDHTTSGAVITAEQIRNLPTKNINALAAQTAGLSSADEGDAVNVRGSRTSGTDYYIDGIRVSGNLIPGSNIKSIEVMSGGVSAEFGGGIVELEEDEFVLETASKPLGSRSKEIVAPRSPKPETIISTVGLGSASYSWGYSKKEKKRKIYDDVDNIAYPIVANCDVQQSDYIDCYFEQLKEMVTDNYLSRYYYQHLPKGAIDVELTIGKDGRFNTAKVINDYNNKYYYLNYSFNRFRNWRPAMRNGKAVASKVRMKMEFDDYGKFENKQYSHVRQFYAPRYNHYSSRKRQRQDFRTTVHWAPIVPTNANGEAKVQFWNTDDVNTFNVTVEGFGKEGQVGRATKKYFTQLPFSLEAKIPSKVLTGDIVKVPVMLSNNTDKTYDGKLSIVQQPTHFIANNEFASQVNLKPNEHQTVYLEYKVQNTRHIGNAPLTIKFIGNDIEDQISEIIETKYSGFPTTEVLSSQELKNEFEFNIKNLVDNSMTANFFAHPSMLSEVMGSLDKMLRQPYGCFEQTSSVNYPNIMAMQMIIENGNVDAALHQKSSKLLDFGYKRLLGFEVQGGGFDWYGRGPAHEGLTAYGLMQFVDMKKVYPVSNDLIERTTKWLLSRRDGKGGWKSGNRRTFRPVGAGDVVDAYICWVLSEIGMAKEIQKEIDASYEKALSSNDPYQLALMTNVFLNSNDDRKNAMLRRLVKAKKENGSWVGNGSSVTSSYGKNLAVETTGLTVLALSKSGVEESALFTGAKYLAGAKSPYGFGSTQATIMALKGLIAYSKTTDKSKSDGKIRIVINGTELPIQSYAAKQLKAVKLTDLQQYMRKGKNKVVVEFADTQKAIPFDMNIDYMQSMRVGAEKSVVDIDTDFKSVDSKMGETVRLSTKVINTSNKAIPNTMAIVGIPAGLNLQPWQLRELMDKELVDYYEIFNGNLVFHWIDMDANEVHEINLDLKADIPGTFIAPASSAYLYYDNEAVSWAAPSVVEVGI